MSMATAWSFSQRSGPSISKKATDALTVLATAHPKDAPSARLDYDRGVAMSALDGELIHGDRLEPGEVRLAQGPFQVGLVQVLHRVPGKAVEGGHMLHG